MPLSRSAFNTSLDKRSNELYGDDKAPEPVKITTPTGRTIKPVDIFDIWPDLAQPRRTMPSAVRVTWDGSPEAIPTMLRKWIDLAETERDAPVILPAYLESKDDVLGWIDELDDETVSVNQEDRYIGPVELSLLRLIRLASDIKRRGLINPITIADPEHSNMIETGERRLLAHHLLYLHYNDEIWRRIPAQNVHSVDVWRQASENTGRERLNAISLARLLARLLIEMYQERGTPLQSYQQFWKPGACDRAFFAQVSDGKQYAVPYGEGEKVLASSGLKNMSQLRNYRALLRLPDEAWTLADDYSLPESRLRPIASWDGSDEDKIAAVQELVEEQRSVSTDTHPNPQGNEKPTGGKGSGGADRGPLTFYQRAAKKARKVRDTADEDTRQAVIDFLKAELAAWERVK